MVQLFASVEFAALCNVTENKIGQAIENKVEQAALRQSVPSVIG